MPITSAARRRYCGRRLPLTWSWRVMPKWCAAAGGATSPSVPTASIRFPPAPVDRVLHDGDTVALGGVTLTAHLTAGHTRGCTTWTFRAHLAGEPAGRYRNAVIVGGWRPLSQYRLDDKPAEPASYAGIRADFSRTFSTLAHGRWISIWVPMASTLISCPSCSASTLKGRLSSSTRAGTCRKSTKRRLSLSVWRPASLANPSPRRRPPPSRRCRAV